MSRVGGVDPASGARGGDRFGCAVATVDAAGVGILEGLRVWAPPFSPSVVVAEAAAWLKSYGLTSVTGDRYSGEFVRELFRAEGVNYEPTDRDKSAFFLALLPLCNAGKVRLLDHPDLLRELRGLDRRIGKEGRDRVDHRPGAHDDAANAAAIALVLVVEAARKTVTPAPVHAWAESMNSFTRASYWLNTEQGGITQ
jgi:Terminase RNaseH-like domain